MLTGLLIAVTAAGILVLGLVDLTPHLAPERGAPPTSPSPGPNPQPGAPTSETSPPPSPEEAAGPAVPGAAEPPAPPSPEASPGPGFGPETAAAPRAVDEHPRTDAPPGSPAPDLRPAETRYPWSVLLASFKARDRADQALEVYAEQGIPAYWVRVDLEEKGVWYRVFTGHFPSKAAASSHLEGEGLEDALVKPTRFAALVGVFRAGAEAETLEERVRSLGWCPYTIEAPDGTRRLYAGAFYTEPGAEEVCVELRSQGLRCRAVER